uniref:Uncharacterized protein n=1 Tax=Arundo donax TaxID=35708 RepID=A0A0A8XZW5_ARUDO
MPRTNKGVNIGKQKVYTYEV